MKKTISILFVAIATMFTLNAQILTSEGINESSASNSFAFLDGASSQGYNPFPGAGKGILFPRTDLTVITQADVFDATSLSGAENYNPDYYDGLVVFNTGTGALSGASMGTSEKDVSPGFYFYRNTGTAWNTGVWTPMGDAAAVAITENTAVATNVVTANADAEQLISLTGSADGVSTHIDLGVTAHLGANAVKQFRRANVYDASGNLVTIATGYYDVATNKFVTGNGMMNLLLPAAADYKVELYYTAN